MQSCWSKHIQSARSNTGDLLPSKCAGKSSLLQKELLVEEKGKPETKSLKTAEFRQAIGERNRATNENSG
jgi:hypothetical protein